MPQPQKAIIIHGNGGGTNHDHWMPYVRRELQKLGQGMVA